ncbi:MAG: murein biosynthesis integral membrane protein MurJ [Anaerolineae bacterium]
MTTRPGLSAPPPAPRMLRSGMIVMGAFLLSKVVGLLRDRAIAGQFGAGRELDAYVAAFKIPDLLFTVFAGGALISAFMPVFIDSLTAAGGGSGPSDPGNSADSSSPTSDPWRLASAVGNWVALATVGLGCLAALFAGPLVRHVVAPSFDAAQANLTADLMRIVLISTVIFAVSGLQMGILNAYHHFLTPAVAPILYNLGIWAGALWLAPRLGIHGLAWGVVLGALGHLLIKLPPLLGRGYRWLPVLGLNDAAVRLVFLLMLPRMLALGTVRAMDLINVRLGSGLPPGSLSAINYAWLISQMPQTLLGTAIATVAFPALAGLASRGDQEGLRRVARQAMAIMLALALPTAVALWTLGGAAIDLLLRTGRFDAAAAALTLGALQMFALGLTGHVTLEIVARLYYARKDTWTPLWMAIFALLLNLILALVWIGPLAHRGLALANSVAVTAEVILGLALLRRGLGGLDLPAILRDLLRAGVAAGVMGLAVVAVLRAGPVAALAAILGKFGPLATRPALAEGLAGLSLGSAVGAAIYLAVGLALGVEGLRLGWRRVRG